MQAQEQSKTQQLIDKEQRIMAEVRKKISQAESKGFYGKINFEVTLSEGLPKHLVVTTSESIKL